MTVELSAEAQSVLVGTERRTGAKVLKAGATPAVFIELHRHGLIGDNDGLTRKGLIERNRIFAARLDAAF
jgi:hypothetical protein